MPVSPRRLTSCHIFALKLRNDQQQLTNVEYIIADLWRLRRYQVAFDEDGDRLRSMTATIDQVTSQEEYGIIGFKNGVILLQKGAASQPEAKSAWLDFRTKIKPIL